MQRRASLRNHVTESIFWGASHEVQVEAAYGPGSHLYARWALPLAAYQAVFAASPYLAPQLVLAWASLFDLSCWSVKLPPSPW